MEETPEVEPRRQFSPITFLIGFGLGTFLGVVIAVIAVTLIQGNNNSNSSKTTTTTTVSVEPTALPGSATPDIRPRTKTALDVHLGPNNSYAVIGLLDRDEAVEPVGRDSGSQWLAIRFPPDSLGQGWIPVSGLDGVDNVGALAVALPTPLPRTIDQSTLASTQAQDASGSATGRTGTDGGAARVPTTVPLPTATPRPVGPPDLYVAAITRLSDGRVSVTVGNKGPGDLVGQAVFVIVRNLALDSEQLQTALIDMPAGSVISLTTSRFRVDTAEEVVAIVDPYASTADANRSNNTMEVTLTPPPQVSSTPPAD